MATLKRLNFVAYNILNNNDDVFATNSDRQFLTNQIEPYRNYILNRNETQNSTNQIQAKNIPSNSSSRRHSIISPHASQT
jgi:hypothetical protein